MRQFRAQFGFVVAARCSSSIAASNDLVAQTAPLTLPSTKMESALSSSTAFSTHRFGPNAAVHEVPFKGSLLQKSVLHSLQRGPRTQGPIRAIRFVHQAINGQFGDLRSKRAVLFSSTEVKSAIADNVPRLSFSLLVPQLASLTQSLLPPSIRNTVASFTSVHRPTNAVLGSEFSTADHVKLAAAQKLFLAELNTKVPMFEESLSVMDTPKDVHLVALLATFREVGIRPPSLLEGEAITHSQLRLALLIQEVLLTLELSVSQLVSTAVREDAKLADGGGAVKISRRELALFEANMTNLVATLRWFGDAWLEENMGFRAFDASAVDILSSSESTVRDAKFPCLERVIRAAAEAQR